MSEEKSPQNRPLTLEEAIAMFEPLHGAFTALTISVMKLASGMSTLTESDFVSEKGRDAFENIDSVISHLGSFAAVLSKLSNGGDTKND